MDFQKIFLNKNLPIRLRFYAVEIYFMLIECLPRCFINLSSMCLAFIKDGWSAFIGNIQIYRSFIRSRIEYASPVWRQLLKPCQTSSSLFRKERYEQFIRIYSDMKP